MGSRSVVMRGGNVVFDFVGFVGGNSVVGVNVLIVVGSASESQSPFRDDDGGRFGLEQGLGDLFSDCSRFTDMTAAACVGERRESEYQISGAVS